MRQGDIAFKNGEYKTAINKYFAAEAYDPTKKELVKKRMDSVFNRIDKLRKEAEAAKKQAEHERNRAMRATNQVTNTKDAFRLMLLAKQTAERDPTIALRIAEAALKKGFQSFNSSSGNGNIYSIWFLQEDLHES